MGEVERVAYIPGEFEASARESLERLGKEAGLAVRLVFGDAPPATYDILVAGVPDRALIDVPPLRHLVIPWAGLPQRTRTLLLEFPHVAVHNIHHNAAPTAEMALALLLAAATRLVPCDRALRKGDWTSRYDEGVTSTLLSGKHALILGYGAVGQRIASACQALQMKVTVMSRGGERGRAEGDVQHLRFERIAVLEALEQTDALIIALPLTQETRGLLDAEALSRLSARALLVNIARGPIVDEEALYQALSSGRLGAAGLDVWWTYPEGDTKIEATHPSRFPFHELDNIVMSPHRAGHCDQTGAERGRALHRLLTEIATTGTSSQLVDVERGY